MQNNYRKYVPNMFVQMVMPVPTLTPYWYAEISASKSDMTHEKNNCSETNKVTANLSCYEQLMNIYV